MLRRFTNWAEDQFTKSTDRVQPNLEPTKPVELLK